MEKEKVKGILDWPTFQGVKNIQKFLGYQAQFTPEDESLWA